MGEVTQTKLTEETKCVVTKGGEQVGAIGSVYSDEAAVNVCNQPCTLWPATRDTHTFILSHSNTAHTQTLLHFSIFNNSHKIFSVGMSVLLYGCLSLSAHRHQPKHTH